MRRYANLPDVPTGYPLESDRSWFSIVIPLERTNALTFDTSFETNATNYAMISTGSLARTTDEQYHGAYSLAITPTSALTDGAFCPSFNPTAGVTYAVSCKVKGRQGVPYRFYVGPNGGASELGGIHFRGTGRWQWVSFLWKATAITARIYLRKDSSPDTGVFYWDGLQMESCADGVLAATTYISGDELGHVANQYPPAYTWAGTRFASTATRSGQTRAGGYVMPLSRYNWLLTAIVGLSMASPTHIATAYAQLDGAQYERTIYGPRQFTLAGRIQGRTARELDNARGRLAAALGRDVTGQNQPLTLLYQAWDGERAISDLGRMVGVYAGGLEGSADNLVAEAAPLSFQLFVPTVQGDREQGIALDIQDSITNANGILKRSPNGTWSALSTGISGGGADVWAILVASDGSVYVGGDFLDAGGSGADYLAKYNPVTDSWTTVGGATAINGIVRVLAEGPDGSIYAGGDFTNAGAVAAADYIAKWNGSAWSALGTGANAAGVYSLAFDGSGNLYAGGTFTLMGGIANTVRIAKWNGSAWSAMGTGAAATAVLALTFGLDGTLYAAGSFSSMDAVASTAGLAAWDGSSWASVTTSDMRTINTALTMPDGRIIFGGSMAPAYDFIVSYNGVTFTELGTTSGEVVSLARDAVGNIIAGSVGVVFDGHSVEDGLGVWTGASWYPVAINLPTSGVPVYAIAFAPDGTLYIGSQAVGTATASGRTTVANDGSVRAYPTIQITGPTAGTGRCYEIVNTTTGRALRFDLTLSAGETARLVLEPTNLSFTTDFQGNIAQAILPGSNEADFFLQQGDNVISAMCSDTTMTATISWRPQYEGIGGLAL